MRWCCRHVSYVSLRLIARTPLEYKCPRGVAIRIAKCSDLVRTASKSVQYRAQPSKDFGARWNALTVQIVEKSNWMEDHSVFARDHTFGLRLLSARVLAPCCEAFS